MAVAVVGEGRFAMKTVCEVLNVARSNIAVRTKAPLAKPLGRPPQPEGDLLDEIKAVIGEMPTYGYRRVWAVLRRAAKTQGLQPPNHKRVYRVMKAHGLLLQRHAGGAEERRHDGRIAVHRSNLRWCSDGFELGCDNGEKVRVAFALDCCDREARALLPPPKASRARTFGTSWSRRLNTGSARSIACRRLSSG